MTQHVSSDSIASLLAGTFEDPDGLGQVGVSTRRLAIEPTLAGQELDLVRDLGFGRRIAVVSDPTTREIWGSRIERALAGAYHVESVVLGDAPHPDDETVAKIRELTTFADAVIAVGSGTINDLCKYASAIDGKPYAVFATASSMNGYTSVNAAITVHGHKKSLPAHAPVGAFFDLSILAAAPARLIRAGLGDSLCRSTSQADWLLAHHLFGTPYRTLPYVLLEEDETPLFEESAALMAGNLDAMRRLVRTLILSGFGTAIIGNSQPASQGEHLISHYIDMLGEGSRPLIYHGEQIGVTTLSMARLQAAMLDRIPVIQPDDTSAESFIVRYGPELGRSCWDEYAQKRLDAGAAEALNSRLRETWRAISTSIARISRPPDYLEKVLLRAGAPTTPREIFLSHPFYEKSIRECREIRNRYTFLDLAHGTGRLELLSRKV